MNRPYRTARHGASRPALVFALVLLTLWMFALSITARAAPVPQSERIPVDLRRTTLVVRDIEHSLPLYRDALGMKVIYDQMMGGGPQTDGSIAPPTIRLVLLRANDDFIGVLGLMQRLNLTETPPPPVFRKAQPGQMIFVFNAEDLETRYELLRNTPHVKIAEPIQRIEYPGPNDSKIPVLFSAVWDADGNFVEINRLLGTAAGSSTAAPASIPAQDRFYASLRALCGKRFTGRIIADTPAPTGADPFTGARLEMFVRDCGEQELRIPFTVGEDRSRTWILTRLDGGLRFKHDHRHEDGTPDEVTMYGGDTRAAGSIRRQEFPVDEESRENFRANGLNASLDNVWAIEIDPGERFVYELARPSGRLFRVEFDLRTASAN
jgi:catechol 2,3-dioxygenase-like lactoylglutathione lyase family enzyme